MRGDEDDRYIPPRIYTQLDRDLEWKLKAEEMEVRERRRAAVREAERQELLELHVRLVREHENHIP